MYQLAGNVVQQQQNPQQMEAPTTMYQLQTNANGTTQLVPYHHQQQLQAQQQQQNQQQQFQQQQQNDGQQQQGLNVIAVCPFQQQQLQQKLPLAKHTTVSAATGFSSGRPDTTADQGGPPLASFGKISKIVAGKWEVLKKEEKDVYKERDDGEKRDYLQKLAASKAKEVADQQAAAQQQQQHSQTPFQQNIQSQQQN
ncbi:TOX high mobility group box member 3 [Tyrophagus putrescentiae]|nr:TOX high mobility group box member 3 [Tyrophagus putrescentiae]